MSGQCLQEGWRRVREAWPSWETISYVCVPLAFVVTVVAYYDNRNKAGMDSALGIYRELNHAYAESVKTCLQHPRLDCYVKSEFANVSLGDDEKNQQKILYDMLTNLFESAYVHFVKYRERNSREVNELFDSQWGAWETLIKQFLQRLVYIKVWIDDNNVYDDGLRCHVRYLILKDQQKLLNEILQRDKTLQKPLADWLEQMDGVEKEQTKKGWTCDK